MRHGVIRNSDPYGSPLSVLQTARSFPCGRQQKGKGSWSRGFEKAKLPGIDPCVAAYFRQVGAYQRVVMVSVCVPEAADALQGSGIANVTAERIAAVGRIGYQAALAQDLRGLTDQA